MSLDLGELRIGLGLDRDELRRDIAAARADMEGLSATAQREVAEITRTLTAEGKSAGDAFSVGLSGGADGADRLVDGVHGKLVDAAPELERAGEEIGKSVGDGTERGGHEAGGKLAQGIEAGLIRNSPMIAAAVSGALSAGAPAAIAGAGLMFAGVAAVALKSNADLAASWSKLGDQIKTEAASDAAVLVPIYQHVASEIGDAFEGLRPQLREAFAAAGPEVESLTDGVVRLAQGAIPGLVRAVASGQPVFSALDDLLADVGQGVGEMFSEMSDHSAAAGTALSSVGQIIGSILPAVGDLLSEGSELAAAVLPPVASALGLVGSALHVVAPILPEVVAGFIGLKAVQALSGPLSSLSDGLAGAAIKSGVAAEKFTGSAEAGTKMMSGMGKAASAASGLSSVMGPLGIIVGVGAAALTVASQASEKHAQAVQDETNKVTDLYRAQAAGQLNAGQAADELASKQKALSDAQAKLNDLRTQANDPANMQFVTGYNVLVDKQQQKVNDLAKALKDGKAGFDEQNQSLTVAAAKQQTVADATANLNLQIQTHGIMSDEAKSAVSGLAAAQAAAKQTADDQTLALTGLNAALVQEAALSLAQAGNDLAEREALTAVGVAHDAVTDAINKHGASSRDASQAQEQFEGAILGAASAAGTLASNALPAATDATIKSDAANAAQLATLLRLQTMYGADFPDSLVTTIGQLKGTVSAGSLATAQFDAMGLSVQAVPNSKTIIVSSTSPEVDQQLQALGFTVTHLPDGTVQVVAQTAAAETAIDNVARNRTATVTVLTNQQYATLGQRDAPGHAAGGYITGPGTPTSDSIPIRASTGEFMVKAAAVSKYGVGFLEAVNAGRFAGGGLIGGYAAGGPVTSAGDGGALHVTSGPVHVYLDGQEWRGMARVEAEAVVGQAAGVRQRTAQYGTRR